MHYDKKPLTQVLLAVRYLFTRRSSTFAGLPINYFGKKKAALCWGGRRGSIDENFKHCLHTHTDSVYLFKSRIMRLWKSEDMRRLKDGRVKGRSLGRSGWWLVGMWSCGFLRATLMSFSSLGSGPSLRMASCSEGAGQWLGARTDGGQSQTHPNY